MLQITPEIVLDINDIEISQIRSQGAGGQNVNKVASAIHLRFDIAQSSLPEHIKQKLLNSSDHRITQSGLIIIKSQEHRHQKQNKEAALYRLSQLIRDCIKERKKRRPTRPTAASKRKRLDMKKKRGQLKKDRKRIE